MSPTVTTAVPGASTSPTSAALTSTTPSTGDATMVSASCVSISARLAWERAISARRVGISCSRRFNSSPLASAIFPRPPHLHRPARPCHLPLLRVDLFHPRTGHHQRLALPHLLQHRLPVLEAVAELIELRRGNIV